MFWKALPSFSSIWKIRKLFHLSLATVNAPTISVQWTLGFFFRRASRNSQVMFNPWAAEGVMETPLLPWYWSLGSFVKWTPVGFTACKSKIHLIQSRIGWENRLILESSIIPSYHPALNPLSTWKNCSVDLFGNKTLRQVKEGSCYKLTETGSIPNIWFCQWNVFLSFILQPPESFQCKLWYLMRTY